MEITKATCPTKSRIKLVFLLKNGNDNLKKYGHNPVWYSILSKDKKPNNVIINAMYERFKKSEYMNKVNYLIFYDNKTKAELTRVKQT